MERTDEQTDRQTEKFIQCGLGNLSEWAWGTFLRQQRKVPPAHAQRVFLLGAYGTSPRTVRSSHVGRADVGTLVWVKKNKWNEHPDRPDATETRPHSGLTWRNRRLPSPTRINSSLRLWFYPSVRAKRGIWSKREFYRKIGNLSFSVRSRNTTIIQ
jgi:hypothetical protein